MTSAWKKERTTCGSETKSGEDSGSQRRHGMSRAPHGVRKTTGRKNGLKAVLNFWLHSFVRKYEKFDRGPLTGYDCSFLSRECFGRQKNMCGSGFLHYEVPRQSAILSFARWHSDKRAVGSLHLLLSAKQLEQFAVVGDCSSFSAKFMDSFGTQIRRFFSSQTSTLSRLERRRKRMPLVGSAVRRNLIKIPRDTGRASKLGSSWWLANRSL